MTTLQQIQANPKANKWGSLGSRNRCPIAINVPYKDGKLWCVDSAEAIYNDGFYNHSLYLADLPEATLVQINDQIK